MVLVYINKENAEISQIFKKYGNVKDTDRTGYILELKSKLILISDIETNASVFSYIINNLQLYEQITEKNLCKYIEELIELTTVNISVQNSISFCDKAVKLCREYELKNIKLSNIGDLAIGLIEILKKKLPINSFMVILEFLLFVNPNSFDKSIQVKVIKLIFNRFKFLWSLIVMTINDLDLSSIRGNSLYSLDNRINNYTTPLTQLLFFYAHLLRTTNSNLIVRMPSNFNLSLLKLVSSNNFEVSWAASSILLEYYRAYDIDKINEVILPILKKLISAEANDQLKFHNLMDKYNIPLDFLPISLLVKIFPISETLVKLLNDVNYIYYLDFIIRKKYKSNDCFMTRIDSYSFSMYLCCLSYLGAMEDKSKVVISNGYSYILILDSLKRHYLILKKLETMDLTIENLKLLEISNQLTFSSCTLLKTLSRSASLLRTYFTLHNYVQQLINILKFDTSIFLKSDGNSEEDDTRRTAYLTESALQTLILGIISNLIIEFSASRNLLNTVDILTVIKQFLDKSEYDETIIASLSFIRNALFGRSEKFRSEFENIISIDKIFELCSDSCIQIQIQSFNIIRNLLADEYNESNKLFQSYEEFKHSNDPDDNFVEFLSTHLESSTNDRLTLSICYALVHLAASNVENKIRMMKSESLLLNLLAILNQPILQDSKHKSYWEIRISIAWIIINLTDNNENRTFINNEDVTYNENGAHNEDEIRNGSGVYSGNGTQNGNGTNHDNGYVTSNDIQLSNLSNRARILLDLGFQDALKSLTVGCQNMDFVERAGKAVFQLIVSTGNS